ncbi:MAG: N-acetylmuramoyl-L-alanine amidase [Evtepia sp.]
MKRFHRGVALLLALLLMSTSCSISAAQATDLSGRTIILDAGHGVSSTNFYKGYSEEAAMLKLVLKVKPLLEAKGATVVLTRADKSDTSMGKRVAITNDQALRILRTAKQTELNAGTSAERTAVLNADIKELDRLIPLMQSAITSDKQAAIYFNFSPYSSQRTIHPDLKKIFNYETDPLIANNVLFISFHTNATGAPIQNSANGAEAYYISNSLKDNKKYFSNYTSEARSRDFCNILLGNIAKVGIKKRSSRANNLMVVRETNVPAVLVENGFHTNDSDRAKLLDDASMNRLAQAYSTSISTYFSAIPLATIPTAPPITPTPDPITPPEPPAPDPITPPNPEPTSTYTDVPKGSLYYDAVEFVSKNGLFDGVGDHKFSPNTGMTRAMYATVLSRLEGADTSGFTVSPFTDVDINSWYGKPVTWVESVKVIEGMGNQKFAPTEEVTKQDMVLMLYRYMNYKKVTLPTTEVPLFDDEATVNSWAKEAVVALRNASLLDTSVQNFYPQQIATRADVAQLLMNYVLAKDAVK